ncbi:MAG: hypothetical protein KKB50_14840 [Planctomycetes bacterium]|nr:hypothetical protein [Planctomycetota bacterium]
MLLGSYPAFDNWNLDTSCARDSQGNLQFAVRLWEYNDQNPNYDRYALAPNGDVIDTFPNSPGLGEAPAFPDGAGHNIGLRPAATTQNFVATDSADYVHVFTTRADGGWEIAYAKYDPAGNELIPLTIITDGADAWNFYVQPVILHDGTIMATWVRDTEDICCTCSTDGGATWSDVTVLLDLGTVEQVVSVKTVVGSDDSLHLVWRTRDWGTGVERLRYAKLYPDWSTCVASTVFFQSNGAWYPFVSLGRYEHLHVTFGKYYDVGTEIYYTRLRGDLDLGGAAATDETLSAIQEEAFVTDTVPLHYPINAVDEDDAVHVIYERGEYGRETDKDVYYVALHPVIGDLNCDGVVNGFDIDAFVLVLGDMPPDFPAYFAVHPDCDPLLADITGDGLVNGFDIDPFIVLLGGEK